MSRELLRAWEKRYGLLQPTRSSGGLRLYGDEDAARVARMRRALDDGLSAAEAAQLALGHAGSSDGLAAGAVSRLRSAIEEFDDAGVHAALDESFAAFGIEAVLRDVLLPLLRELGEDWEAGTIDVAQEHFGSNLVRSRLLALARLWGRGTGPLAILACAPGERHDIGLIAFGLVLRTYGWRIVLLGADTPVDTLARAVAATEPTLAVVTSFDPVVLDQHAAALRRLGRTVPLVVSGPGATEAVCRRLRLAAPRRRPRRGGRQGRARRRLALSASRRGSARRAIRGRRGSPRARRTRGRTRASCSPGRGRCPAPGAASRTRSTSARFASSRASQASAVRA